MDDNFYSRMLDAVMPVVSQEDSEEKNQKESKVSQEMVQQPASRRRKNLWQPKSGAGNLGVKDRRICESEGGGNYQYEKAQMSDQNRKSKRHELVSKNTVLFSRSFPLT